MKPSKIILAIMVLATLLLQGCAVVPEYQTFYSYAPPKGEAAKSCLFQCSMTETQCEQIVQMRLDSCTTAAAAKAQACATQATITYNTCLASGAQGCYESWRSTDQCDVPNNCKSKYNSCYSICGGVVSSETRCVANCQPQ